MKTLILATLALALAGCATPPSPSTTSIPSAGTSATYYWLHPKQGMMKVDRATNATLTRR